MGLFGSIGSALFGSKPEASVKSRTTLTKEQRELLKRLIPDLESELETARGGVSLEALEQSALSALEPFTQTAGTPSPVTGASEEFLTTLLGTAGSRETADEFFRTNIEAPLSEALERAISDVGARFGGQFFGGERREAEARLREDFIDALTQGRSDVALRLLELATQAAGQAPGIETARAVAPTTLAGIAEIGGLKRRASEEEVQRATENLLSLLGIPAIENIGIGTGGSEGILSGFARGFGAGFGGKF